MRRTALAAVLTSALLALGCTADSAPGPTEAANPAAAVTAVCPSPEEIGAQIAALFPPGVPANGRFASIRLQLARGDTAAAQAKTFESIDATLQLFYAGLLVGGESAETQAQVLGFINSLYCFVGLPAPDIPAEALGEDGAVAVVGPTTPDTVIVTGTEFAGVHIPAGAIPQTTTIAITRIPDVFVPTDGPLATGLDQYPLFYEFSTSPSVTLGAQVLVGICQANDPDFEAPDFERLQLAHNVAGPGGTTIELLPRVDAPFLDCADADVTPPPEEFGTDDVRIQAKCCLGGLTSSFSPFGAVDPESEGDGLLPPLDPGLEGDLHSLNSDTPTSVEFVNTLTQTVRIYWLDFEGDRVLYNTLTGGQSYVQLTYVTHPWVVTNLDDEGLVIFQPTAEPAQAIIE